MQPTPPSTEGRQAGDLWTTLESHAAEADAVEGEPVDVGDGEPGVLERGERRLAGQLEERLGERLAPPVVRSRADADDRGLVLGGHAGASWHPPRRALRGVASVGHGAEATPGRPVRGRQPAALRAPRWYR